MYLVLAIAIVGNMYGVIAFVDFKKEYVGDFQKNEDFSFSENNLNIKWYERKVNILKQAQW